MEYVKLNLETLNKGAAKELFDEELEKVLKNVHDLNVEQDFTREIRLVVKLKPTPDRTGAITTVQCSSKLAQMKAHQGSVHLAFSKDNKPEAYVHNVNQTEIDFSEINKQEGEE